MERRSDASASLGVVARRVSRRKRQVGRVARRTVVDDASVEYVYARLCIACACMRVSAPVNARDRHSSAKRVEVAARSYCFCPRRRFHRRRRRRRRRRSRHREARRIARTTRVAGQRRRVSPPFRVIDPSSIRRRYSPFGVEHRS